MKYVAFDNIYLAKAAAHREAYEAGIKGKLYLDDLKVKLKETGEAVIEVDDSYVFVLQKLKDKEKATEAEALADKVEKVKSKKEKSK
jgi:hypothetical protein